MSINGSSNALEALGPECGSSPIYLSGLSHREVSISLRERFAIPNDRFRPTVHRALDIPGIEEAVVLSTCNRVEIVAASHRTLCPDDELHHHIEDFFEQISGVPSSDFADQLYHLRDFDAITHLFRVASGLDSLVLGEPQILGQLKAAYEIAHEEGATSALLNRAFHRAFGVAKSIRTKTRIGRNAVSVCYAAKELAGQIFGDLSGARVMLIGAGDMGALALKHFHAAGCSHFFLVNKTLERALGLAEEVDGVPLSLANFHDFIAQADIIIGAATLPDNDSFLITKEDIRKTLRERPGNPQFLIDLGVPRNFDPSISELSDAFLYNVDDLEGVVKENLDARALEVENAQGIIDEEVLKFQAWLEKRTMVPMIKEIVGQYSSFGDWEARKTLRRLKKMNLSAEQMLEVEQAIADLSQALVAKSLHLPLTKLKNSSPVDRSLLDTVKELFLKRR